MNDSRDFQGAESVRSGIPTLPVNQCHSHLIQMLSRSTGMPSRREGPPSIWDTHGISGNVFANPVASSSALYPQELNPFEFRKRRTASLIHSGKEWETNTSSTSEMPVWTVSQKFCHPQWRRLFKELWSRKKRLQISDLHFDKFPTPATFACWKVRFKTEVCTCSQFPTEATHWIKEVEMVDSVDDSMSSSSTRGTSNAIFWSAWCEDCFSTEPKHP